MTFLTEFNSSSSDWFSLSSKLLSKMTIPSVREFFLLAWLWKSPWLWPCSRSNASSSSFLSSSLKALRSNGCYWSISFFEYLESDNTDMFIACSFNFTNFSCLIVIPNTLTSFLKCTFNFYKMSIFSTLVFFSFNSALLAYVFLDR